MSSLRKSYKTDTKAEEAGVWVSIGYNETLKAPVEFLIARMTGANKRYSAALEKANRPYEAEIAAGTMNKDLGNELFKGVFIETILLGWRNVSLSDLTGKDEDDAKPLEFNADNASKLMDELPDVYQVLFNKANSLGVFTEASVKATTKN